MHQNRIVIVAVVVIVLSQWPGMIWLSSRIPSINATDSTGDLQNILSEINFRLKSVEEQKFSTLAKVDPEANTVTIDQSLLQVTLREIVADELDRISSSLSAEYTNSTPGTAYVGETTQMAPEQAYTQSAAIIQEAIQYGEWDGVRTAQMAPLVNNLTQEQRIALLEQYHAAVNRGEIKMTGMVPPL